MILTPWNDHKTDLNLDDMRENEDEIWNQCLCSYKPQGNKILIIISLYKQMNHSAEGVNTLTITCMTLTLVCKDNM